MELACRVKQKLGPRICGVGLFGYCLESRRDRTGNIGDDQHDNESDGIFRVVGMEREKRLREEEVEHDHRLEGYDEVAYVVRDQHGRDQYAQNIDGYYGRVGKAEGAEQHSDKGTDGQNGVVH